MQAALIPNPNPQSYGTLPSLFFKIQVLDVSSIAGDEKYYDEMTNYFYNSLKNVYYDEIFMFDKIKAVIRDALSKMNNKPCYTFQEQSKLASQVETTNYNLENESTQLKSQLQWVRPQRRIVIVDDLFTSYWTLIRYINAIRRRGSIVERVILFNVNRQKNAYGQNSYPRQKLARLYEI